MLHPGLGVAFVVASVRFDKFRSFCFVVHCGWQVAVHLIRVRLSAKFAKKGDWHPGRGRLSKRPETNRWVACWNQHLRAPSIQPNVLGRPDCSSIWHTVSVGKKQRWRLNPSILRKYPTKILGIHNIPKRTKRIQKDPKNMFLHVSITLFHEAEPFQLNPFHDGFWKSSFPDCTDFNQPTRCWPMQHHAKSCDHDFIWFCSKNYVEETHWNMVSIRFWRMPNWIELPFCWNSAITGPLYCWERSVFESYDAALDSTDKGVLGWDD